MLAPLLIAYDAEDPIQRRFVDQVQRRDRQGLIIAFPIQNPELVRVAPELAGRCLWDGLYALDTGTRCVCAGAAILPVVCQRLPRLRWIAPLLRMPFLGRWLLGYGRTDSRARPRRS